MAGVCLVALALVLANPVGAGLVQSVMVDAIVEPVAAVRQRQADTDHNRTGSVTRTFLDATVAEIAGHLIMNRGITLIGPFGSGQVPAILLGYLYDTLVSKASRLTPEELPLPPSRTEFNRGSRLELLGPPTIYEIQYPTGQWDRPSRSLTCAKDDLKTIAEWRREIDAKMRLNGPDIDELIRRSQALQEGAVSFKKRIHVRNTRAQRIIRRLYHERK
ncbi:unnamed protein product (mitochondrion) [Plasmodiophora brassicae]|uniref:Uncharacterized protein n=1 Tax=Plasmodiophora brassicae TaxID=37360 RepID=A0A0G4ITG2_PLABS|nr:hypothetical protein PBRA_006563 [Plasmodiophora brassicae]SPQ94533.1 unnamed protein product [Plasmodiophora brassicae]